MEHEVVDRGVGKAEEGLGGQGAGELVFLEEGGQEAIGIVAADGAEDPVDRGIPEGIQKVLRAGLGMIFQKVEPVEGMGHKADGHTKLFQPAQTEPALVGQKAFAEHSAGQAHDGKRFDFHKKRLLFEKILS